MLPDNFRKDSDDGTMVATTREIMAPPGKLGIVIDTTLEGPVVHEVKDTSALMGKIFPGDLITSIDGVDTCAMSAAGITSLMIKTANRERILTVVGDASNRG